MSRNLKRIAFLNSIRMKQQEDNRKELERITMPKEIKPEQTILFQANQEILKKAIVGIAKAEDLAKGNLVQNKNVISLIGGFFTTENKEKYVRLNADHIKDLNNADLQRFVNVISPHL